MSNHMRYNILLAVNEDDLAASIRIDSIRAESVQEAIAVAKLHARDHFGGERHAWQVDRVTLEDGRRLFYTEYKSGNCSVIAASNAEFAREAADDFARSFGTRVSTFRGAVEDDLTIFNGAIYQAV